MLTAAFFWVLALAVALAAAELLVHATTGLGHRLHLSHALLGLLVAAGADAPEVTSALFAAARGSSDVGIGVVIGSNIYNLAGLLGLAALLARRVRTPVERLTLDTAVDLVLTALVIALVAIPSLQVTMALMLLVVMAAYAVIETVGVNRVPGLRRHFGGEADVMPADVDEESQESANVLRLVFLAMIGIALIVVASSVLVSESTFLGPRLGIPNQVMGTVVLAVATSLPNTWAAVSLVRRHMPEAAISAAFNSNSINAAIGAGVPALFVSFHVAGVTRTLDVAWLGLMTAVAALLVAFRRYLRRVDGSVLVGLYGIFLTLRFTVFG